MSISALYSLIMKQALIGHGLERGKKHTMSAYYMQALF